MEQENLIKTSRAITVLEIIVIIAIIALIFFIISPMFHRGHPPAHNIRCMTNLRHIALSVILYYEDNANANTPTNLSLPTPDKWNDLTIEYLGDDSVYMCPLEKQAPKTCTYILNKNLYDLKGPIPPDVVLAFEGPTGWNQTGGPEDMVYRHGSDKDPVCNVALAEGSSMRVKKSEAANLKWKPE
ncbi:MAG: hypothetical protein FVQ82_09645 [Planctomycetes bacterium]|nr:hypothetical protein [Planctomycetota bacterium]